MSSKEKPRTKGDGELSKPAKRQRKVAFADDVGLEPSTCITIRLVSLAEEMQEDTGTNAEAPAFSPDFSERFFGEDGKIYGYKNLKITIWVHALSFHAFVDVCYGEKMQDAGRGMQITDLQSVFKEIFGAGLIEDRDTFLQSLSFNNSIGDVIHLHGTKLAAWKSIHDQEVGSQSWLKVDVSSNDIDKEILCLDLSASQIREWHTRLMPFVLLFIEAGRPIDQQDPRWEVYVTLEKLSCKPNSPWRVVGFCTVYNFYKYPDSTRLRVSQILVLPPYQGKRNGLHLLEAVYDTAVQRECYDVTMEEPSESLQELRDFMDVVRLLSFQPARSAIQSVLSRSKSNNKPHNHLGFCEDGLQSTQSLGTDNSRMGGDLRDWMQPFSDLVVEVRKQLKISKMQLQRCWDVLLFLHLHNSETHAGEIFKSLIEWRLKIELFGKSRSTKDAHNKQIIDTESKYDSSKTFVMTKGGRSLRADGNDIDDLREVEVQQQLQDTVGNESEIDNEKELQELIKDREGEIERVAEKVILHCKSFGIALVSGSCSDAAQNL